MPKTKKKIFIEFFCAFFLEQLFFYHHLFFSNLVDESLDKIDSKISFYPVRENCFIDLKIQNKYYVIS